MGHRLIELDLGPQNTDVTEENLESLLKVASPQKADALMVLLKASDTSKVKLLQSGTVSFDFHGASPLPAPHKPTAVEATGSSGAGETEIRNDNSNGESDSDDEPYEFILGKRSHQAPKVLEPEGPSGSTREKKLTKTPVTEKIMSAPSGKRGYNKTGIYSKDPLKAAQARAAARSSDSETPSVSTPSLICPMVHVSTCTSMHLARMLHFCS